MLWVCTQTHNTTIVEKLHYIIRNFSRGRGLLFFGGRNERNWISSAGCGHNWRAC